MIVPGLPRAGIKPENWNFCLLMRCNKGLTCWSRKALCKSNHVRQTAAAACKFGLDCHALLERRVPDQAADYETTGNVLFDHIFGTTIEFRPPGLDMNAEARAVTEKFAVNGRKPYFIPGGGSNEIGALGYVSCAYEMLAQFDAQGLDVGWIVLASGSAGTHAGLLAGLHAAGSDIPVMGISVRQPRERQIAAVHKLAAATAAQLTDTPLSLEKTLIDDGYVGAGYGLPTEGTIAAINLIARKEGVLLDPVYSAKGLAGMIGLTEQKFFDRQKDVVFLHTGGAAALFAYGNQLASG